MKKEKKDIYRDQKPQAVSFYDRTITSSYLPWGIKCMDSDFAIRIKRFRDRISGVYSIVRTYKNSPSCVETYEELPIDNRNMQCFGIRVIWEDGYKRDFFYEVYPKYNKKTRMETKRQIALDIKNNPHLDKAIKENLLLNLKNV